MYLILAKFRYDWIKIVDFLLKGHFRSSPVKPLSECIQSVLFVFMTSNAIYANYHKNRLKAQTQTIKMWKNLITMQQCQLSYNIDSFKVTRKK